jgi:hypothetical protein
MKFYFKWGLLVLGPFALLVAGFVWWQVNHPDGYSREELDADYNRDQVERLQLERQAKDKLDEAYRRKNRPGG